MYQSKCLFRNTNETYGKEATAIESVWAYLHGVENKKTGRYRIRITKMTATELVQMGVAPEDTPADFYGLQATLDQWHKDHGWLALFDWIGDPMSDIEHIEKDLGKQFQAFVTGISMDETFQFDDPVPPKPPKKPKKVKKEFKYPKESFKYPKLDDIPKDKINDMPKNDDDDDSDDLDWL